MIDHTTTSSLELPTSARPTEYDAGTFSLA